MSKWLDDGTMVTVNTTATVPLTSLITGYYRTLHHSDGLLLFMVIVVVVVRFVVVRQRLLQLRVFGLVLESYVSRRSATCPTRSAAVTAHQVQKLLTENATAHGVQKEIDGETEDEQKPRVIVSYIHRTGWRWWCR